MKTKISSMLDGVADRLEAKGFVKEASEVDIIANTIEKEAGWKEFIKRVFPNMPSLQDAMKTLAGQFKLDTPEGLQQLQVVVDKVGKTLSTAGVKGIPTTTAEGTKEAGIMDAFKGFSPKILLAVAALMFSAGTIQAGPVIDFLVKNNAAQAYQKSDQPQQGIQTVYTMPDMPKDSLYDGIKSWVTKNLMESDEPQVRPSIKYENKDQGTIIVRNGIVELPEAAKDSYSGRHYKVPFTMQVDVQDGKYRISFSNLQQVPAQGIFTPALSHRVGPLQGEEGVYSHGPGYVSANKELNNLANRMHKDLTSARETHLNYTPKTVSPGW